MLGEVVVDRFLHRGGALLRVVEVAALHPLEAVLDVEVEVGLVLLDGALDRLPDGLETLGDLFDVAPSAAAPTLSPTTLSAARPAVTSASGAMWLSGEPSSSSSPELALAESAPSGCLAR
jgi:hypothetical protein